MEKLLSQYSISEIVIFLIIFALATKEIITFIDWALDRNNKFFLKKHQQIEEKKDVEDRLKKESTITNTLEDNQEKMEDAIQKLSEKIDTLIASDIDDIKAYITKEHHYFCYQKGWIDDYSLECCEKRYVHYVKEGGNSFIGGLMEELRQLPKQPPQN